MKKLIVKILALTLLMAFSHTLSAQTEGGIEKQKAAITALLNKGDCDGAQAKYNKVKVTGNVFPDIEKRIADCKNNKSAKSEPTPKPAPKPTPKPAPKTTLDVTPQTLSFAANGGSKSVTVNASSGKWNKPYSQEKWVTLATKGNTVTVTVSANTNTQKRSTSFKVVSGNLSKTVSITQDGAKKQNPQPTKPKPTGGSNTTTTTTNTTPTSKKETSLSLSSYSESFEYEGESKTITVNANEYWVSSRPNGPVSGGRADWYIGTQPDASWVSYTKDGDRLTIKVSPNTKTTKRTDYFTVKCGDVEKRFDITQAAKPIDRSYGEWVDLGLHSGTLWKNVNEKDLYTYDKAVSKFDNRLPSKEQLKELEKKCSWIWDSVKKGYNVVGPNGNSIFLPAAGYRTCNGYVLDVGSYGHYMSSSSRDSTRDWHLSFNSGYVGREYTWRCIGKSVRLVHRVNITQAAATPKPVDKSYGEWVDLGLPSGTLWKNVNEKDLYNYDNAISKFGNRLPSKEQFEELINKCSWVWYYSEKKGYNVVGPNGNSIFLPAAGRKCWNGDVDYVGSYGNYWSSTPDGSDHAWDLDFYSGDEEIKFEDRRGCAISVRLVQN